MGLLAEAKIRRKINQDPNNTKWTRDTTTFGQKILRAQGWEPGQFLGAKDAPHSELHTAANASYIRVVLKDDMKGLGFQRAKEDQVTGLDVFQDLLSRLNGKSDDLIEQDQQARLAIKTHHFVEQRYGPMRFVRGGLLVGDELRELKDDDDSEQGTSESETNEDEAEPMELDSALKDSKKEKKSKKRKAMDDDDVDEASESEFKSKRRRKEERKREKKAKKDKSRSKKDSEKNSTEASEDETTPSDEQPTKRKSKKDKSRSVEDSGGDKVKESKKSKKEKKEKKEKKRRKKEEGENSGSETPSLARASATPSAAGSGTSTPIGTGTGTGTSTPRGSRNFVRSRFIAEKRQALMDTKALAQIFMVKA